MQTITNVIHAPNTGPVAKASKEVAEKAEQANGSKLPVNSGDCVNISQQGKSMLANEQKQHNDKEDKTVQESVTSFAHGALGMDHPEAIQEQDDSSYSAGQYASAAITIGSILLALV